MSFIVVIVVGCAMTTFVWAVSVRHQRSDPSRCRTITGLIATGVDLGSVGEPDQCAYRYVDRDDVAYPDATVAGAVTTTPFGRAFVLGGATSVVVAMGLITLARRVDRAVPAL